MASSIASSMSSSMSSTIALTSSLSDLVNSHVRSILESIAKTYNISEKELKEKYLDDKKDDGVEKKRRGRKKKQKDEYIETEECEYEGVKYLVDGNNNVYTFNLEEPALIGERFVDGTIRFFSNN